MRACDILSNDMGNFNNGFAVYGNGKFDDSGEEVGNADKGHG